MECIRQIWTHLKSPSAHIKPPCVWISLLSALNMDPKSLDPEAQSDRLPDEKSNEEQTAYASQYDVFWQEPASEDPENPMNWSFRRKWSIIGMVSFITFLT